MATPQFKQLRQAYGFDDVAIVPGDVTINPDQTNIDFKIEGFTLSIPIIASAMDAVTDVNFAILMSQLGGIPRKYYPKLPKHLMPKLPLYCKRSILNRLRRTLLANEYKRLKSQGRHALFR